MNHFPFQSNKKRPALLPAQIALGYSLFCSDPRPPREGRLFRPLKQRDLYFYLGFLGPFQQGVNRFSGNFRILLQVGQAHLDVVQTNIYSIQPALDVVQTDIYSIQPALNCVQPGVNRFQLAIQQVIHHLAKGQQVIFFQHFQSSSPHFSIESVYHTLGRSGKGHPFQVKSRPSKKTLV
nr:MAG TPA: hypothetical protein [Bacteriophage sp.]